MFRFRNFSVSKLFHLLDSFGFGIEKILVSENKFGFGFVQIFGIVTHCIFCTLKLILLDFCRTLSPLVSNHQYLAFLHSPPRQQLSYFSLPSPASNLLVFLLFGLQLFLGFFPPFRPLYLEIPIKTLTIPYTSETFCINLPLNSVLICQRDQSCGQLRGGV